MRIDALLVVDKPEGVTSLDVVRELKSRFTIKKAGHVGTLDPFATGVLPIVINEATKLVPFLEDEPKEYDAVLKLGEETTTDDLTGKVMRSGSTEGITPQNIQNAFGAFRGKILQIPPMFSAVKVKGVPLYKLARRGVQIERREREVEIFDIEVQHIDSPYVRFRVSCSKGTYVRTLARDIGKKLGCGAYLVHLRRIRSGSFTLTQAIPMEKIRLLSGIQSLHSYLIPMQEALAGLPEVIGDEDMAKKIRYGREMVVKDLTEKSLPVFEKDQWLRMSLPEKGLVAILKSELKRGELEKANPERVALRPIRVFNHGNGFNIEEHI